MGWNKDVGHEKKPSDGMFDENGAILLDPTPMLITSDGTGHSMREVLENYFASERLRNDLLARGEETMEDFLDFGPDDEDHPGTVYSLEDERDVFEANQRLAAESLVRSQSAGQGSTSEASLDARGGDPQSESPRNQRGRPKPPKPLVAEDDEA